MSVLARYSILQLRHGAAAWLNSRVVSIVSFLLEFAAFPKEARKEYKNNNNKTNHQTSMPRHTLCVLQGVCWTGSSAYSPKFQ